MKFQKEVNIYSPEAIVKRFKANEIALSVQKGKIESLISESEIIELQNEKVTMYSKMSDIKQTVDGLSEKYTSIKTGYDAVSEQYTDLDLKVAEYKKGVDSFSAELTKVKSNLENNYSTTVEMNTAITAKVGEITASVSKTYATKSSVDGIRVGGRNLVKNADRLDGKWSDAGTYVSETKVVDDEYALSGKHIEVKCTKAGPGPNYPVFPKTLDKLNKTYTWSFYAKCSVKKSGTVGHECGGRTQIELTTAWKKFTYTWKYTDEEYSSFTFYLNFKVGEILYIRDFKIEEGTKATSWTLSPEDYSTTAEMNAAIKVKVDEISASVSKTYATKSSVDGIRVGGRNLVKNADRLDGKWSDAGTYVSETKVVDDEYALSGKHIEVKCTKAGPGPNYPVFSKTLDKLNKTYTWSFYAKCSVEKSGTVGHECGGRTQIELTTAWKKFSYTWKYTDEEHSSFTFYLNFKVGEILYIRDFKIEEGTKATSWTLSPEDYSTTAEMNAAIKIRADAITSEVSKKIGASEIISKINQSAEKVSISASKINFNGLVTANNYFKVNTDGSIEAIKGKIGGWTITSNSLSAENISLNASYGAMKFSSNGKVVFTQNSRGSMYYTQYTDDRNYNALLFGRTGIKPVHKDNSDEEEIWLNDIEPDENWVLKYTSNRVVLNANVVNAGSAKIKNAVIKEGISVGGNASVNGSTTFEGQIKFRDWENLNNKDTPIYRHPIASTTTDGTRIAYIASGQKKTGNTDLGDTYANYIRVRGEFGLENFITADIYSGSQNSDIRLKNNIRDSDIDALTTIGRMQVRQFDWKKGGHQNIGFVADELEEVDPNLALGGGYYENGEMNIKQVNTPYLVNYTIKAIQELSEIIHKQDERIQQLEQKVG